jgi:hypothetical protein
MGNSLSNKSSKKTRSVFPMYDANYEKIVKPSGMETGKQQLAYIKDKKFIKKYEEPYTAIKGHTLNYYIPVGTKLYHSSFIYYQKFDQDRVTYFGIDIIIALWYLLEESEKSEYSDKNYGFIYEFDVIKDIPVYILENIKHHPYNMVGDGFICQNKEIACIHPQYAYHGDPLHVNEKDKEMSTELTMNLKKYPIGEYIKRATHPITEKEIIYLVSINNLREIAKKKLQFSNYNSIRPSIVGMVIPDNNQNSKKGGYRRVLRKTKKKHFKSRK